MLKKSELCVEKYHGTLTFRVLTAFSKSYVGVMGFEIA